MVGLALILLLVTLQFAGSRFVTERQEVSAVEINLSGRQRMLSQRIGWTLYRIAGVDETNGAADYVRLRSILAQCVHLMEVSHRALLHRELPEMQAALGAGEYCLSPEPNAPSPLPDNRIPINDGTILSDFTQEAWIVATSDLNGDVVLRIAREFEPPLIELLNQLDQATLAAQEGSTAQLERLLSWNWFLIVALVLAEIILIFRPMSRAVEQSIEDLTDANTRLTEGEARLQGFAATAAHQLWETDTSHRFTFVAAANPNAKLVSPSDVLGKALWELGGGPKDVAQDPDWKELSETLDARQPVRGFEFSRKETGNRVTWWRIHAQPVFSTTGAFKGYRGTSLEITSERESEERLRLSERMMAIGQLTAGIAHDFNNILAVIQGNAELLPLEKSPNARERSAQEIVVAVRRGASLTSRLLSFGRVQRLSPESIDVSVFLRGLETLLNRTLGEDFDVTVALPDQRIQVLADRHQLEDAALNLAINARDAASAGGRLWIEASLQKLVLPTTSFSAYSDNTQFVKISFRDNGAGIPENIQEHIFEPFFTTKSTGVGSGLGLSMVYGFAHQSDGFLEVQSAVGQGTTIDLYLPQSLEVPDLKTENTRDAGYLVGEGMSALLVEDNSALREVIKRQLEHLGFLVVEAIDGGSAIERIKDKGPFDFLLLDIILPGGIDGVDVALFALEEMPKSSILFCTGFASDGPRSMRQKTLPGPVIAKPFSVAQLQKQIADVISVASKDEDTGCRNP